MTAPMLVHYSQARADWETPPALFAEYDAEFGFTLDVCALPETAKCARYFTPEQDGLAQSWTGEVCWMNPPYGRVIAKWMQKAWEESQRGATVVCLVPARTDTAWWHEYAERAAERRFLRGRVAFLRDGAHATHASRAGITPAPFPCVIVVFRPSEVSHAR